MAAMTEARAQGGVARLVVETDEAGLRLDRWFRRRFPALGHGRLEKLLRTGQVRVDGGRAKAAQRLEAGQEVRVPPLGAVAADHAPPKRPPMPVSDADAREIEAAVLHIDDSVLVLNKPAGLAVQGGAGTTRHVDGMLDALRFGRAERPRLVHRLDRDTSGVLVLARSARAAAALTAAFRGRDARKIYWALVAGAPRPARGRIDAALAKRAGAARSGGEAMVAAGPDAEDARQAATLYDTVERAGRRVAWLALLPLTGRTHQLRVHCALIGTPIVGDGKYGGAEAHIDGLAPRLHLHARAIALPHPDGGTLRVAAPLTDPMRESWRLFGFEAERETDSFPAEP